MIWSSELQSIELGDCPNLRTLDLRCPALVTPQQLENVRLQRMLKPAHPPLHEVVKETYKSLRQADNDSRERTQAPVLGPACGTPLMVYRKLV